MSNFDDFICNVLIMGKTGTGKSTLLNYLCDKKIADTGTGKPVTGEGIYEYTVNINNQEVRLFDSWGIEAGKTDRWNELIEKELKKHGVQKRMEDWFHCVIYCIQAGGGRVEDIDSDIIQRFLRDGYHLTIILTKADQVAEDDEATMKEVILNEISGAVKAEKRGLLKVVATCAEKKELRGGKVSDPFGKDEAIASIFDGWRETIIDRMPKHVIGRVCEEIDEWAEETKNGIIESEGLVSGIANDNKAIRKSIAEEAKDACQIIQDERLPEILKEAIESCHRATNSIETTFSVQDTLFDFTILENSESLIFAIFKNYFKGFFIIPAIVDIIKAHSKDNIATQKAELCDFVDEISKKIKEEMGKCEEQISKIIEKALQ